MRGSMPQITGKRLARAMPFAVLFGAVGVLVLALPWIDLASPQAANYALAGVMLTFLARWFSRKFRSNMRAFHSADRPKLSPAQKRERRRADRRITQWVR